MLVVVSYRRDRKYVSSLPDMISSSPCSPPLEQLQINAAWPMSHAPATMTAAAPWNARAGRAKVCHSMYQIVCALVMLPLVLSHLVLVFWALVILELLHCFVACVSPSVCIGCFKSNEITMSSVKPIRHPKYVTAEEDPHLPYFLLQCRWV